MIVGCLQCHYSPSPVAFLLLLLLRSTLSDPTVYRLYEDLMEYYEKDIRPSKNHSHPVNVTFGFSLTQIIDVDERNQILTLNAWINQMWIDYKLSWNASQYNGIRKLHIPHHKVWRPDIVLYNNADSQYNQAILSTDVFASSGGNVTWLSSAIFKSSCGMNVRYYPFDEQECLLKFASWAYDGSLVDLVLLTEVGDISNYMTSTEWDLLFIGARRNEVKYSCCEEAYPDITITLRIRRKPLFYVFNLILPCGLITAIALLGFYMPSDSGEKVTLGITTLLSMTVFLMLVAESMPPTSDTLPLIGMYYGVTICLVSVATALTVFTLNIHHKGVRGAPVPKLLKKIAFNVVAKVLFLKLDPPEMTTVETISCQQCDAECHAENEPLTSTAVPGGFELSTFSNGVSPRLPRRYGNSATKIPGSQGCEKPDEFENQFLRVLDKVYATIEKNEVRIRDQDRRDAVKLEWQQVALVVDRFLLVVFIFITTLASLLIMYQRELDL